MQPIFIYMLTYIIPVFVLIALATYVMMHNNRAIENRLIFLTLIAFIITLCGEFARHVSPFSYNPFLTSYVVGVGSMFAMAIILHLEFILIEKHCNIKIHPFIPYLGYFIVPLHALMATFFFQLTTADFHKSGIWIYRDHAFYNIWLYGIVGLISTSAFFNSLYGWLNSKTHHGNKLFRFLSVGTIIISLSFFMAMLLLKVDNMMPNPTMALIVLTGILFALGITKFELTPSIQARYQSMFNLTPTSIMLLNERLEILEINQRAKTYFSTNEDENFMSIFYKSPNIRRSLHVIKKLQREGVLQNHQAEFIHPITNEIITVLIEATLLPFQNVNHYYIMWQDISHEVEQEKVIRHLAFHDALTGIQNRAYFVNNVQETLQVYSNEQHALVLIDLNYFKQINDLYGHSAGDAVLQFVAVQLQFLVGERGIVARLGGDEFVILFKNIQNQQTVAMYIEEIRTYFLNSPFQYDHFEQAISMSFGSSIFPVDGNSFEILFHIADMNMYDDKSKLKALAAKKGVAHN